MYHVTEYCCYILVQDWALQPGPTVIYHFTATFVLVEFSQHLSCDGSINCQMIYLASIRSDNNRSFVLVGIISIMGIIPTETFGEQDDPVRQTFSLTREFQATSNGLAIHQTMI